MGLPRSSLATHWYMSSLLSDGYRRGRTPRAERVAGAARRGRRSLRPALAAAGANLRSRPRVSPSIDAAASSGDGREWEDE